MPLATWTTGFTSCAFGGKRGFKPSDNEDEGIVIPTWNVAKDYIKFYNPMSKLIDTLQHFGKKQACDCPIHNKGEVIEMAERFFRTGVDAVFSSTHDMHKIQDELNSLGKMAIVKIKANTTIRDGYKLLIGKRRDKL